MEKPPTKIVRSVISHVADEPPRADLTARLAERDAPLSLLDDTPMNDFYLVAIHTAQRGLAPARPARGCARHLHRELRGAVARL